MYGLKINVYADRNKSKSVGLPPNALKLGPLTLGETSNNDR